MRKPLTRSLAPAIAALLLALAGGCERNQPSRAQAVDGGGIDEGRAPAPDPAPPGPVELEDVSEAQPDYGIGISYPRSDGLPPDLAAAMKDYAESARADLMEAVESRRAASEGGDGPMTKIGR